MPLSKRIDQAQLEAFKRKVQSSMSWEELQEVIESPDWVYHMSWDDAGAYEPVPTVLWDRSNIQNTEATEAERQTKYELIDEYMMTSSDLDDASNHVSRLMPSSRSSSQDVKEPETLTIDDCSSAPLLLGLSQDMMSNASDRTCISIESYGTLDYVCVDRDIHIFEEKTKEHNNYEDVTMFDFDCPAEHCEPEETRRGRSTTRNLKRKLNTRCFDRPRRVQQSESCKRGRGRVVSSRFAH
ncbi:hypothetical protein LTS08_004258 [Lithohypha guttulata]|nr:hypothetical protein LTS08_004258 [Lithohypha guttulata]